MNSLIFELTENHLKLFKRMNIRWNDNAYDGSPEVDIKRPYGNSNVFGDIAEILEIKLFEDFNGEKYMSPEQEKYIENIHREMGIALQIVVCCCSFELGKYQRSQNYLNDWKKVD